MALALTPVLFWFVLLAASWVGDRTGATAVTILNPLAQQETLPIPYSLNLCSSGFSSGPRDLHFNKPHREHLLLPGDIFSCHN